MINREFTRTILNGVETTAKTKSIATDSLPFVLETTDAFYLGYRKPFTTRYFHLSVPSESAGAVSVSYWNGTAWSAVEDLADQTDGFTKSGFISWVNPGDWQERELAPIVSAQPGRVLHEYFWVRIQVASALSAGTALQSILNLFCDSDLLRALYPEIVSDTRFLPPGRTDLLEQLNAGKDLVVETLKANQKISDESQLIDINPVAHAAAHATAYVILQPIASASEATEKLRDSAWSAMKAALANGRFAVDEDDDGEITPAEAPPKQIWMTR